jgi:hypothetical protein
MSDKVHLKGVEANPRYQPFSKKNEEKGHED